jgi:hypothetical protein
MSGTGLVADNRWVEVRVEAAGRISTAKEPLLDLR